MNEITPPIDATPADSLRRLVVLLAAVFAVAAPLYQSTIGGGLSQAAFADDGDETLRAASYAFSIWSLIYGGLVIYALHQVWPRTPEWPLLEKLGWPSVGALLAIGAWIPASANDAKALTLVLIVMALVVLLLPLWSIRPRLDVAPVRERLMVAWPLAALAGWLTVASALNILTVMTAWGVIKPVTADLWSLAGIGVVTVIAVAVVRRTNLIVYAIPVVWGLIAVWVAENADNPLRATAAAASAAVVAIATVGFKIIGRRKT